MARVMVLSHAVDRGRIGDYLVSRLARYWLAGGHDVQAVAGLDYLPPADIAILHVDLTVVPEEYLVAIARYPVVINGAVRDISKRVVSRNLLQRGDNWAGQVFVKPDLNAGGGPEWRLFRKLAAPGTPPPPVPPPNEAPYFLFPSLHDMPEEVWSDHGMVVERFLPEREGDEYCTRAWVFFGDRERCTRYRGTSNIVKSHNILAREPSPVPDELRVERERLGFDYGKFDFVFHDGKPVLFDANRTPGAPPDTLDAERGNADLAGGLDAFLKRGG
jgi:hypothetical protein